MINLHTSTICSLINKVISIPLLWHLKDQAHCKVHAIKSITQLCFHWQPMQKSLLDLFGSELQLLMLHTCFRLKLTWELWCKIVEPKNCTPYETWAGNLIAHIAKCMKIQDFIWQKKIKQNSRYRMSKSLNINHLDIFQGISIHYTELEMTIYFSLEMYNNNGNFCHCPLVANPLVERCNNVHMKKLQIIVKLIQNQYLNWRLPITRKDQDLL